MKVRHQRTGTRAGSRVRRPEGGTRVQFVQAFQDGDRVEGGEAFARLTLPEDGDPSRGRQGCDVGGPVGRIELHLTFGKRDPRLGHGEPRPQRPGRVVLVGDHEGQRRHRVLRTGGHSGWTSHSRNCIDDVLGEAHRISDLLLLANPSMDNRFSNSHPAKPLQDHTDSTIRLRQTRAAKRGKIALSTFFGGGGRLETHLAQR